MSMYGVFYRFITRLAARSNEWAKRCANCGGAIQGERHEFRTCSEECSYELWASHA